jgi:hypothetical protein
MGFDDYLDKQIISINSINQLICVMDTYGVFYAAGTIWISGLKANAETVPKFPKLLMRASQAALTI